MLDVRAPQTEQEKVRPAATAAEPRAPARASERPADSNALDLLTLGLAALGSVVAALVTSQFWAQGTVISAAVTPVIISLFKDGLRRPVQRASAAGARAATASKGSLAIASSRGAGRPVLSPRPARAADEPGAPWPARPRERDANGATGADRGREHAAAPEGAPNGAAAPVGARGARIYRRRGRPRLRIALITGILAFVIAALALTIPELVIGGAPGRDGGTTFFGGGEQTADEAGDSSEGDEAGSSSDESQPSGGEPAPAPESESAPVPEEEAEPAPAPQEEAPAEPQKAPAAPAPSG